MDLGSTETAKTRLKCPEDFSPISEVTDFLEHWDLSMTKEAEESPWQKGPKRAKKGRGRFRDVRSNPVLGELFSADGMMCC